MFVLTSDITIGKFRFSGVHEVVIRRSIHSIEETAIITIPSVAKIITNGKAQPGSIIAGKQFADGDPVTVRLGYNNDLQTEFKGFVKRRSLNMPLTIECEGYSWQLRRNKIKEVSGSVTLKELLNNAVAGVDSNYKINVQCDVDITLGNVHFKEECGFDVINSVAKDLDGNVSCFFIAPNTLWCGMLYTEYAAGNNVLKLPQVKYRLGYNVIKNNSLKEKTTEQDPAQVSYSNKLPDGSKVMQTSDVFKNFARLHKKILKQIQEASVLKQLAVEKAYQLNYGGYEGHVNTFLQPHVQPGYEACISDARYPERDAAYLIESTETVFGISGARRKVEIGPRSGFSKP